MDLKPFAQFVRETPNETNQPVSIGSYFSLAPNLAIQPLIPDIIAAVKDGSLSTRVMMIALAKLTPTQRTVSQPKVEATAARSDCKDGGTATIAPVVMLDKGTNLVLDGHHRVCAYIRNGLTTAPFRTLTAAQVAEWHQEE